MYMYSAVQQQTHEAKKGEYSWYDCCLLSSWE